MSDGVRNLHYNLNYLMEGKCMNVKVLGTTHVGYLLAKEEALDFGGKAAGVCYMPSDFETLMNEPKEKTLARVNDTLKSGHHSVYDHVSYNLLFESIPKILAMVLNNEGIYTTSEKSARYTQMKPSEEELFLYNKWNDIFKGLITEKYFEKYLAYFEGNEKRASNAVKKLAQENARYMISVFTPTTMIYSVSFRQINYIVSFFEEFIETAEATSFNQKLKEAMLEFIEELPAEIKEPLLTASEKGRKISLFDSRVERKEEFSENYCTTYKGTFAELAQAQRHRTLDYKMRFLPEAEFYVPEILKENDELSKEWTKDITSIAHVYPQGMLVSIRERGTYEKFILKCYERLCGCAQLEIALQTKKTLDNYLEQTKETNVEVYEELEKISKGARCTFPCFKCNKRCVWGAKEALTRKI